MSKIRCVAKGFFVSCIFATVFSSGCVPPPQLLSSSPRAIVVGNLQHSAQGQIIADQECARYGRYAIHRPDNVRDGIATYECIK